MEARLDLGDVLDRGEWAENVDWTRRLTANVRATVDQSAAGEIRDVLLHRLDRVDRLLALRSPDLATAKSHLRSVLSVAAGATVAECFQSPSVVMGAGWDYHRDRHRLGAAFEREWLGDGGSVDRVGLARARRRAWTDRG